MRSLHDNENCCKHTGLEIKSIPDLILSTALDLTHWELTGLCLANSRDSFTPLSYQGTTAL